MMALATGIDCLPNEIMLSILSALPSRALVPLTTVNFRFHAVALSVLQSRLAHVAALPDHRLILECYHPSVAISTPWLYCDYLCTDGVEQPSLGDLGSAYSHFRPVSQEDSHQARQPREDAHSAAPPPLPSHDIHLDEGELFTQLCTITNVVKEGPGRWQHFLSHANVSDGVIRVWRKWLEAAAATTAAGGQQGDDSRILWTDAKKDIGLRFRVREIEPPAATRAPRRPLLIAADDDAPVSYRLEYEELLVRTSRLLFVLEESQEEKPTSGNALMLVPG